MPMMMSDLLPERLDKVAEEARKTLCENEDIGCMKLAWDYVGTELQGALKSALDCDALSVFAKTWAAADKLSDYSDPAKHPPGERSVIELGAHEIKRELEPVVAVTVGSCPCIELKFTFAVTGSFGGVKLSVMNAHITGGSPGEAWASGQLSYNGVPLHQPAESRKLPLPGTFEFAAPGIPIPRLHSHER
jgi:hypothetical protein